MLLQAEIAAELGVAAELDSAPEQADPNSPAPAVPLAADAQDSAAASIAPAGSLAAALAAAGVLTSEQQAILQDAWDEQLGAAEDAGSDSDSDSDSDSIDVGVAVSAGADEGTTVCAADAGTAVSADSVQVTAPERQSLADQFKEKLQQPLWECNGEKCTLLLCQVMFMLMAWKMDYCVRDAAFAALLGMLSEVLLPKVSGKAWA